MKEWFNNDRDDIKCQYLKQLHSPSKQSGYILSRCPYLYILKIPRRPSRCFFLLTSHCPDLLNKLIISDLSVLSSATYQASSLLVPSLTTPYQVRDATKHGDGHTLSNEASCHRDLWDSSVGKVPPSQKSEKLSRHRRI